MNMLKKGPELKLPEIKVPDFLLDIYYDLRERHLLPLVAILLVAIVALPIVLSSSSGSDSAASEASPAAISSLSTPSSKLVVAQAAPGLRDYHHRLGTGHAKDPFVQQYAEIEGEEGTTGPSVTESASPSSSENSSVTVESTSTESTSTSPETTTTPGENGNGEPTDTEHLRYYSFAIDVRIVPVSSDASTSKKPKPSIRHNLPELTMLPGRTEPALTFMDVSKDEKKILMLVSDKVTGLFGDGVCVVGSERCQLLALEPGIPETVVYGPQEHTFRIELLKLHLLTTDKLHKAPLSKPQQEKGGKPKSPKRPAE